MLILAAIGVCMLGLALVLDGMERARTNRMRDKQIMAMHGEIAATHRDLARLARKLDTREKLS